MLKSLCRLGSQLLMLNTIISGTASSIDMPTGFHNST